MRLSFILIILLSLSSCDSTEPGAVKPEKPDNLLEKKKVLSILADIHIAEAAVSQKGSTLGEARIERYQKYEYNILKNHGVDSSAYFGSFRYYTADVQEAEKMFNSLIDTLLLRKEHKVMEGFGAGKSAGKTEQDREDQN